MRQKEVFKKIGGIIQELIEQYEYLESEPDNMNELELELFVANAHFLTDHIEILIKLNLQNHPVKRPVTRQEPTYEQKYFEPLVRQMKYATGLSEQVPPKPVEKKPMVEPHVVVEQKPVVPEHEQQPVPHIDLAADAPEDTYSLMQQAPEAAQHELTLNEASSVDAPGVVTLKDVLAASAAKIEEEQPAPVVELPAFDEPLVVENLAVAEDVTAEEPAVAEPLAAEPEPIVEPEATVEPEAVEEPEIATEPEIIAEPKPDVATQPEPVTMEEPEPEIFINEPEVHIAPPIVEQVAETISAAPSAEVVSVEPEIIVAPTPPEPQKPEPEKEEFFTINDRISAQMGDKGISKTEQMAIKPISDIKLAITLNDKLLYVKDLFNGYNLAYSEAIEILNRFNTFEEAMRFLKTNYVTKNNWESKPTTTEKFYALLKRRYA